MPAFRRWLPAAGLGLLTYFTVRLLNDTMSGSRFWERPWALNLAEMAISVLIGYTQIRACHLLMRYFDQPAASSRPLGLTREMLAAGLATLLIVNVTILPFAAVTDDGLSAFDAAAINTIPLLFVLVYYGWVRSRHYLRTSLAGQLQLERIAHENVLTELKFLRAQYHPHFLFNALNTVYFQMDEDVPAAKHSLEQLAELLRYQLYDQQQPVRIAQELQYLRSYLELQRVRSSEKLRLAVEIDPQLCEQRLYPLLLLPLLENAFKYLGGAYELAVLAQLTANGLAFRVRNSVAAEVSTRPGGIGLENLRRRLQLLYPGRHELTLTPAPAYFVADLTLALLPA